MASLTSPANIALPSLKISPGSASDHGRSGRIVLTRSCTLVTSLKSQPFPRRRATTSWSFEKRATTLICAAATMSARCAAEQTQTVTRQSSTITIAPIQGKEKSPELDDGGTGFPPRDDDDGGGGGGGGGPGWSGGFFFFGFLAYLGLLQDKEREGDYRDQKKRYSY